MIVVVAQAQEPVVDQVKGGLLFHLAIQHIIKKLQKHHVEHQHRVPGVSPPIGTEALAMLLDKAKIHHLGLVLSERGVFGTESAHRENCRKRNRWLCPFWSWSPPNNYLANITISYVDWQPIF